MTRNVILYIATSLDGYIADRNGSVDWLDQFQGEGDHGYNDLIEQIDTVMMGRKTYEHVLQLADQFPYTDQQCYVFSSSKDGSDENVTYIQDDVGTFVRELKQKNGKDIWIVGGGSLLKSFLEEDLVDEFRLFMMPIILGDGVRLFENQLPMKRLTYNGQKQLGEIVELRYKR